ncbi:glycosyl hydrolase [Marinoscillum furvescens]|uniref:glucan endo-1,3-beta-D-glucosidase n=1 Tax=Marinoscillum furvescens DSM 4134 TaxID=1122208 RepID=A0A3D9KYM0_MARFU|nr:glycosyl hydrolase [Marinoscillum furvescens]RED94385.1 endoglucanase Acf2 [Marinoscillum furvescens DSM 4134]
MKTRIFQWKTLLLVCLLTILQISHAQIISVGSGSYTTTFPGTDQAGRNTFPSGSPTLSGSAASMPVPTNDWWSNLIKENHGGQAFNYPLSYKSRLDGLTINYTIPPTSGPSEYRQPMGDVNGIVVGVDGLNVTQSTASDHSDWTVTMNWSGGGKTFNATMGTGMPFTYFTKGTADLAKVVVNHNPSGASVDGNKIIITNNYNNANFVVFGPAGSTWTGSGGVYTSSLNGKNYWSMAMLPFGVDINTAIASLEPHAFVFPENTTTSWSYNESNGEVLATFSVTPDIKEGSETDVVLGLLPHQWSRLATSSPQPGGMSYETVRGELKLLHSNSFSTQNTFSGILPTLPNLGKYSDGFDPGALYQKIDQIKNDGLATWTDSYNEGQAMNRLIQAAHIADQIGHVEARDQLLTTVKNRLEDWFTSEGGEVAFLFYYNDTWKSMLGYPAGHRQDENLNDHHFHWGYFIHAAAAIEQYQPGWASQWGGMVDLLIRDAANPSRTDPMFPFLRNFSPYAGHCWANGFATEPFGNDQESTSESMQFNSSLIHWGTVTGNDAIRDLGIFLYTTEQSAIEEYWFDQNDRTFQPEYAHEMVARIWGGGYDNGTWWTSDIAASYGIQLYPIHGGALYMGHNTAYVQEVWNGMTSKTDVLNNVPNDNLWYDTYWSFLSFLDPAQALSLYNSYTDRNIKFGISDAQTYHWLHTMNAMGQVAELVTANYPIAAVFQKNGTKTYVAHNYGSSAITVSFSDGYTMTVPAGETATNKDLNASITLSASTDEIPSNGSLVLSATATGSSISKVEFYRGNLLVGTDTSVPYEATDTNVPAGFPAYHTRVYVGSDFNVSNIVRIQSGAQTPYLGSPTAIPGTLEAGYYDSFEGGSGQGVSYSDATSWNEGDFRPSEAVDASFTNGEGHTVGWIDGGEWLEYTVDVAQAGDYSVTLRYTSGSSSGGGPFWFENENGTQISPSITVSMNDPSWSTYEDKTVSNVSLSAGTQVIRVQVGSGGFNLGRMTFTYEGTAQPELSSFVISPENPAVAEGNTIQFTAQGYDQFGDSIASTPSWSTTGGSISTSGQYSANTAGTYTITASEGDVTASTSVTVSASAALSSISVTPSNTTIPEGSTQQFTAQGYDQNGDPVSISPTWSASGGDIASSGLFTGTTAGSFTVTATASGISGTAQVTVTSGTSSCSFSAATGDYTAEVSGSSNPSITFVPTVSGVGNTTCILYYGTSPTGGYPGYNVTPNQPFTINASSGQTIYFYYTYSLPQGGENNTSNSRHSFEVGNCGGSNPTPVLASISVSPSAATISQHQTQQYTAQGFDQNGDPMSINPTWSTTGGAIDAQGHYTPSATGNFTITATADGVSGSTNLTVTSGSTSAYPIPGQLEAEAYTSMSGIQTETSTDTGGGENVGWIDQGDWLTYEVDVAESGTYTLEVRVAAAGTANKMFDISLGGNSLADFSFTGTGGWQNWTTITENITLTAGVQTLQLNANSSGFNINWLTFTANTSAGGCSFDASTGDYSASTSDDAPNPTITFVPSTAGVGSTTCILYYGTSPTGGYPGYHVTPNQPYQITAAAGETIYFYYTYSLPTGGENNTSSSRHNFTVGSTCSNARVSSQSAQKIRISPNPASRWIQLSGLNENEGFQVIDLGGKVWIQTKSLTTSYRLAIDELAPGVYLFKTDGGTIEKFIKR